MGGRSAEAQFGFIVKGAEEEARKARRHADELACHAWNLRLEKLGGPAQPSPTIGDAINTGFLFLEAKCMSCKTSSCVALANITRPGTTPLWQLESSLVCRPCKTLSPYPRRGRIVALHKQPYEIGAVWYPAEQRERG
jgi:hypothetical protein